jgi:hypothetical protein
MEVDAQNEASLVIYLRCLEEAKQRLAFAERFAAGNSGQPRIDTESACLQLRKALELIAYAAIAPHRAKYEAWRRQDVQSKDFRKDYNGKKILNSLAKLNPYSYPRPLLPLVERDGAWHFDVFRGEYLTKKRYEKVYDRCGALLHADNPWGHDKQYTSFMGLLPNYVTLTRNLIKLHSVIIEHEQGTAAWVIEAGDLTTKAKGHIGQGAPGIYVSPDYYE